MASGSLKLEKEERVEESVHKISRKVELSEAMMGVSGFPQHQMIGLGVEKKGGRTPLQYTSRKR